ncbi:TetR/AcrR family transcriptional regulator [Streptomyces sp. S.PB5]|uniref:TetR/AcrR family transcriptional regulator n=1 Tax=Streptomyces sp. S.PB5 TaxID=3020844 RepID=UPI0025B0D03D|nr:TetR/AcrR family transcriptional regulator [Streptomyces sp. S.PB5]MDN3026923.1 helix-turn-helix domain containing protein [Streptomyces sp. S.PB5]
MLYAVFMSADLPPFPRPHEPLDEAGLFQLGIREEEPCLRADAARNRARLLEAAARLIAEHGAAGVTMEAVAAAAQVGKGTVFRRFGDRTGLLMALLDHSARQLQADFMSGPPPLGPGAPPLERLRAFGVAMLYRSVEQLDLQLAAEPEPTRRFSHPSNRALAMHVTMLLRQIVPDGDCELLARTLLAYLDPAQIHYLTRECGMPMERLEAGWSDLVARVTRTAQPA